MNAANCMCCNCYMWALFVYCSQSESEGKKLWFGTKQSVFYVTVRSRSESRAWPIFRALWRQYFCSMHWKPWLLLLITTLQSLRWIRRLSRGGLTTHHSQRQSVKAAIKLTPVCAVNLPGNPASCEWICHYTGTFAFVWCTVCAMPDVVLALAVTLPLSRPLGPVVNYL